MLRIEKAVALLLIGAAWPLAAESKKTNCPTRPDMARLWLQKAYFADVPPLEFEVPTADVKEGISDIEIEPCGAGKGSKPIFIPVRQIAKIGSDAAGMTRITVDPSKSPALMKVWSNATALVVTVKPKGKKELKPIVIKSFKKSAVRMPPGRSSSVRI